MKKLGTGTLTLSQENAHTGDTTVSAGTLALVHSSHNNLTTSPNLAIQAGGVLDVTGLADGRLDLASGQTLQGGGTVTGTLGVSAGATVSPGASPGILNSGRVVFGGGSTFAVDVQGTTVGTEYDQLSVTGTVELGGATLALSGAYVPASGDTFVIISNDATDGVSGTFAGLPEGAGVVFQGIDLKISYQGGVEGNDVTLHRAPPPTAATLAYFRATAVGPRQVRLSWGTLAEVWTLGFHVDLWSPSGGWQRVSTGLIPALGWDQRPRQYSLSDVSAPELDGLEYCLVEVNTRGQEMVVAHAATKPAVAAQFTRDGKAITVAFRGQPDGVVTIKTASAVTGPWTPLSALEFDAAGACSFRLEVNEGEPARYYHWDQE